jgi:hypothetical protein
MTDRRAKASALCVGAVLLAGAAQPERIEERHPAFQALLSAIESRDTAAIEAMTRRDIVLMRLQAYMPAWELIATLEGCTIVSVRPPSSSYRSIRFACPQRRTRIAPGSCDSGDLLLSAELVEGKMRLSLDERRADRPECIPPPPPPMARRRHD